MSIYKPTNNTPRSLENTWMNTIFTFHDSFCNCQQTILHLLQVINKNSNCIKPLQDISNIKCLLTGKDSTETTSTKEEDDVFDTGDLETLFAEDGDLKEPTEDTER